ncbi:hypothetical protein ONZ45_g18240 [Pleurotus djamor]|nr:hypothetical protein ONZ45_g18240 [Pleurotus djamor]
MNTSAISSTKSCHPRLKAPVPPPRSANAAVRSHILREGMLEVEVGENGELEVTIAMSKERRKRREWVRTINERRLRHPANPASAAHDIPAVMTFVAAAVPPKRPITFIIPLPLPFKRGQLRCSCASESKAASGSSPPAKTPERGGKASVGQRVRVERELCSEYDC